MRHDLTAGSHVVHEPAWLSVWRVHRTKEAPRLRQKFSDRGGSHLGKGCSSVHAAKVRQVSDEVEFVSDDTQTCVLQHAQS